MITLYDYLFSGNGYKVRLTLRELGIPFRHVLVDILQGGARTPEFLAKNPTGQIPVIELEDGRCLSESSAIMLYLAEGTALLPSDSFERAKVVQWLCFEQTHVDGVISRARFRKTFPQAIATRPEEFEAWWRDGKRALRVLDEHLRPRRFLVGDTFTIADICNYAYVHRAEDGGFDLKPYDGLRAWFERVQTRPAHVTIETSFVSPA